MRIGCNLRLAYDAVSAILHKVHRPPCAATANKIRDAELGVRVDCCPRPNVAPSLLLLFERDILSLRSAESPNFIALEPTDAQVADVAMVVCGAGTTHILN